MKAIPTLLSFNRGLISKLALARVDLKRSALSSEIQTNWMARTLGSMMLRPGLGHIGSTLSDAAAIHIPFIFSFDDMAIIELTDSAMRVRVDEAIISRVAVATAITNGAFTSNVTGWTDADESGASSAWVTGGFLGLTGTLYASAIRTQQVTVASGDRNKEHALRIVVARGPVKIKVGSTSGAEDYIAQATLRTGVYSLAFTPTGDFHITLSNIADTLSLVDSIAVESAGDMAIISPWLEANLPYIRWDQSGDVVFVACEGVQQRRIERYATRSWGIAYYAPEDGPFRSENVTTIRLTPNAISGNITLTSSAPLFRPSHALGEGTLFRITSIGQLVQASFSGEAQFGNAIRITGVGGDRQFSITISGTWSATVRLQRSVGDDVSWINVIAYSGNVSTTYNDGLDNQIVYYRLGIETGSYTSGTAVTALNYANGGLTGVARVTGYTSPTSVSAAVLKTLGGTSGSENWSEGDWSGYRGFPSAVSLYEGRLWWAGKDKTWGSVSDAFESFDDEVEGDSGPVSRSIGSGPVDRVNWLLPLLRLLIGTEMAERTARSSSLDEPLTPTNFNLKTPSTRGSSPVSPVAVDGSGLFVRKNRLFQLDLKDAYGDYQSIDLTMISPEVGSGGFRRLAVQRYPDTRIHCVRNDGKVAVLVFDSAEDVKCWIMVETDGVVEDAFVLPDAEAGSDEAEDKVYYLVKRTIGGVDRRFLERWALESECAGGTLNKQADSYIAYTGTATSVLTGLDHLEGEEVVVWADGKDYSPLVDGQPTTYTVTGGQITLPEPVENAVAGLYYEATYKSTKLAYGAAMGTALTQRKRVDHLGLILANTHAKGLRYGMDFENMDDLPGTEDGAIVDPDHVWADYDKDSFEFPGEWGTDSRICLKAAAPRPVTLLAVAMTMLTDEKA